MTTLSDRIRAYLIEHPTASATETAKLFGSTHNNISYHRMRLGLPYLPSGSSPQPEKWTYQVCVDCGARRRIFPSKTYVQRCFPCANKRNGERLNLVVPPMALTCNLCGQGFELSGHSASVYRYHHRLQPGRATLCSECWRKGTFMLQARTRARPRKEAVQAPDRATERKD